MTIVHPRPGDHPSVPGEGDEGGLCGHPALHRGLLAVPGAGVHDAADQLDRRRRSPHEHRHRGHDMRHRWELAGDLIGAMMMVMGVLVVTGVFAATAAAAAVTEVLVVTGGHRQ